MTAPDRDGGVVELKPCPFCGAEAEYSRNDFYDDNSMARCKSCGAEAFWKKWNARISPPTPVADGLVGKARELLADELVQQGRSDAADNVRAGGHCVTIAASHADLVSAALRAIAAARDAALEEAAKVADNCYNDQFASALQNLNSPEIKHDTAIRAGAAEEIARKVRALISNAAPVEGGE